MPTYRKLNRRDWSKSLLVIAIYVVVISITALFLLIEYWYFWLSLVAGGLFVIILGHKKSTAYRYPKGANEFEISFLSDFFSPHGVTKDGGWMYLKCPRCQNRRRMKIIVKENSNDQKSTI